MRARDDHRDEADEVLRTLDRVVREERVHLVHLARREGLSAEDAIDCVHDAFCTFLQLSLAHDLPADVREHLPLLTGILRNAARNKHRRHHLARPHEAIEQAEVRGDEPSSESLVARAEDCVRLRACVDRLCQAQRTVVLRRLLDERAGEDVASELGITRGHVDVLLHRAKAALRGCMSESEPVEGR